MGVLRAPGERQLGHRAAETVGDRTELLDPGDRLGIAQPSGEPGVAVEGGARVRGDAVAVLAGEQAGGERAPDRVAVVELRVDPGVLRFDLGAFEDVVLALLGDGPVEVVAVGDVDGGTDLVGRPFTGTPVEGLAGRDDVAHRPHGLLDRRVRIGPVAVEDVDEVEAEPIQ